MEKLCKEQKMVLQWNNCENHFLDLLILKVYCVSVSVSFGSLLILGNFVKNHQNKRKQRLICKLKPKIEMLWFQTYMTDFLLQMTKEGILKTASVSYWLSLYR